jgi:hypothetical protein
LCCHPTLRQESVTELERERAFVCSIVDGPAIVTIRDLQGRGCATLAVFEVSLV